MKLSDITQELKETDTQFFERTLWFSNRWPHPAVVFVYNNARDVPNPELKPAETMTPEEALAYLETLRATETTPQNNTRTTAEPIQRELELVSVSHEEISTGVKTHRKWINSVSGEVMLSTGKSED